DGKSNDDGHSSNHSSGWGYHGDPTDSELKAEILAKRWRFWKAAWASHMLAPCPLIHHGDEVLYHPGSAHNNRYSLGDDVNGIDLESSPQFLAYSRGLAKLRRQHPNLGRMSFVPATKRDRSYGCYHPLGDRMPAQNWHVDYLHTVVLYLPGNPETDER